MQVFSGIHLVSIEAKIKLQTYRDDNGPTLVVIDDHDHSTRHIRLTDADAKGLGSALMQIANASYWKGGDDK